jgi:hypothetical protein
VGFLNWFIAPLSRSRVQHTLYVATFLLVHVHV